MTNATAHRGTKPRLLHLAPVATLLASVGLLVLGNGLLGTLLVVRAGLEGFVPELMGVMMSAYFGGYALGAFLLPPLVLSAGHIRTFAGFASIASAATLVHLLLVDPWAWTVLRVVTGFAYAGMILVTESWLNAHAVAETRGRLLSIYGMITMGVWAAGQGLLTVALPEGIVLFLAVSILVSLALVPITLLPTRPPADTHRVQLAFRRIVSVSPLGTAGALVAGLSLGAFWGMGPNYMQQLGFDTGGISAFMAAALIGALVVQWPLGWLSDRYPRRMVIAGASLVTALAAFALAMAPDAALPTLLALGFAFGGFGIPIYALCVAHANDGLVPKEMLGAARALLLLNGLGAAAGPFAASLAMGTLGPGGLFLYSAALIALLALGAFARHLLGPVERLCPTLIACAPQVAMAMDTRGVKHHGVA